MTYFLIFLIQKNEIFTYVIRDPLFFPFVNRFRDPSPPVRPSSEGYVNSKRLQQVKKQSA